MCGIVGFTGKHQAAPILLDGLSKLEYRGYDSAGIAVRDGENETEVIKAKGRLKVLIEKTNGGESVPGTCGIGHTRWATHGEPSETNAHPHVSDDGNVVAVHNGIIENYQELKEKLLRKGYTFYSATDTEVAVNLVDYYYKKYGKSPVEAVSHAMVRIRGSYALAMMFRDYPGEIFVARKDSPMILGVGDGESYIASDVPAILKYTRNVYYIGNLEFAKLTPGEAHFYNLDGDEIEKETTEIKWDAEAAEKAGFEHFMMKEIHEQPKAVSDTINSVVKDGKIDLSGVGMDEETIRNISQIYIVACGSAYHVGMAAQYVLEDLARIPVRVELASEFRYRNPILDKNGLAIIVSQSGETADSLAALRECKARGIRTLAIVNVIGSSIAREADNVFYTLAGPEISVATTKAYSTQLIASYILALQFAKTREEITEEQCDAYIKELQTLPEKIEKILEEAHKTNKNLFGQVIEHSGVEVADEETDVLAQTDESVEEKVTENHDDEVIEQAEKFEKSDETESKDDNNLQNTVVDEGDVITAEEERKSDAVVSTTSGNYEYFGAVDENGLRTGRGRTVSPSGITAYDGEYAQGKRDGFGVFYYKNGDINYVGDWKENQRSGAGVGYRTSDGTMHIGKWENNSPTNYGARFNKDGTFIDFADYANGVKNGKCISLDENGNFYISIWENGKKISEHIIEW